MAPYLLGTLTLFCLIVAFVHYLYINNIPLRRFYSDVYSTRFSSLESNNRLHERQEQATIRWSINENLVSLYIVLQVNMLAGDETDMELSVPVPFIPHSQSERYVTGIGLADTCNSKCFLKPGPNETPEIIVALRDIPNEKLALRYVISGCLYL